MNRDLVIAILAKDKEKTLPLYLSTILSQDIDKSRIRLYIKTNDNSDSTTEILQNFVDTYGSLYKSVLFESHDIDAKLKEYSNHQWNAHRFGVLAKIRQDSVQYAIDNECDYFVADCDNFVDSCTIKELLKANLPVVAPMLRMTNTAYSNFHYDVDELGYLKDHPMYYDVLMRNVKGLINVAVVHCTYLIRFDALKLVNYLSTDTRHEYVIFSENLRKANVPQVIDNRYPYGFVCFVDDSLDVNVYQCGMIDVRRENENIMHW